MPEITDKLLTISGRKIMDKKTDDHFFLVSFIENDKKIRSVPTRSGKKIDFNQQYQERIEELERELQYKSENLQAAVEELETSNEELQSSNEELIASNEELQSTNEELQSVNEELYTVNSEHLKKIEELTEANADMDNLLKNTHIGTLFLDQDLTIRKVNRVASELTNIRNSDVGRPIHHLSFEHLNKDFITDIQTVIENLRPVNQEIQDRHRNWYLMRIIPYRTAENAVDGIIITFVDTTSLRKSETHVMELSERLKMAMEVGGISWWEWNCQTNNITSGDARMEMLGYEQGEIGNKFDDWNRLIHPDDRDKVHAALKDHLEGRAGSYESEYRIKSKSGSYFWYKDKGGLIRFDDLGNPLILSGVVMNVTMEKQLAMEKDLEHKIAEEALRENDKKYEDLFRTLSFGVVFQDAKGRIILANPAAERILGLTKDQMMGRKSIDPRWKSIHVDGSDFAGEDHPAMKALKTGKEQRDIVMGVFNPELNTYSWININAIPFFRKGESKPYQVYATFEDITSKRDNNSN